MSCCDPRGISFTILLRLFKSQAHRYLEWAKAIPNPLFFYKIEKKKRMFKKMFRLRNNVDTPAAKNSQQFIAFVKGKNCPQII